MLAQADFERAYRQHYEAVVAVARGVLGERDGAEDVAQDVFAHLWRRPQAWEPARGPLSAYLRLLARSRAIDAWRRRRAGEDAATRVAQRPEVAEDFAEARAARLSAAPLRRAVSALPPDQRAAVWLVHWNDFTFAEAGAAAGVPTGTAKSRMRLALARLRTAEPLTPPGRAPRPA